MADKVLNRAVWLVDEYVNQLPGPTAVFPNGSFNFNLERTCGVHISPAFANGQVWRTIGFSFPIEEAQEIFLDGPTNGVSGNIRADTMGYSLDLLTDCFRRTMHVTRIGRNDVDLDLSQNEDFETFYEEISRYIIPTQIVGP